MIKPFHSRFLSPTKDLRRLSVMHAIHQAPESSQHAIARITHLSSSMVNNYIRQLKAEKLIYSSGATSRTQSYHLTPAGAGALRSSLLAYSAEIVQMYGAVKHEIASILESFYTEGVRTVVLFGAAETAEVVHAALKETDLVVIGVVDSDASKHHKPFNGLIIKPPEALTEMQPDAVVITSFAHQEEIHTYIEDVIGSDVNVKKLSDLSGIVEAPCVC